MPTKRMHIKSLLSDQEKTHNRLFSNLLTAIIPLMSEKLPK
jgi:hypothetical protein